MRRHPFQWPFPVGVAGGGGGGTQPTRSYDPDELKIGGGFPSYLAPGHLSLKYLSLTCAGMSSGMVLSRISARRLKWRGSEPRQRPALTQLLER